MHFNLPPLGNIIGLIIPVIILELALTPVISWFCVAPPLDMERQLCLLISHGPPLYPVAGTSWSLRIPILPCFYARY